MYGARRTDQPIVSGGDQRKCHANRSTFSRGGDECDTAAELLGHEIVDDVEAEPGTTFRPPRGEERIEDMPLGLLRNACSVVGEGNFDEVVADAGSLEQI